MITNIVTNAVAGRSLLLLFAAILNAQLSNVFAQGTAFTYQGRLDDGGVPRTGNYDFQFYLRDAPTGGGPVGATNTLTPVGVTNGLFTVKLDFGNNPFGIGAPRWLEMAVRTNNPLNPAAPYSVLTPRQALTSVPYALTASNLTGALPASQVSGALADGLLSGNVALLNRAPQTFTGNNSFGNVTVNAPSTLSFGAATRQMLNLWGTQYGIGVQPSTHYFRADANASFAWYAGGVHSDIFQDPGIGGTRLMVLSAGGGLDVYANSTYGVQGFSSGSGTSGIYGENLTGTGPGVIGKTSGAAQGVVGDNPSGTGWAGYFNGRLFASGRVGLGTTTPTGAMDLDTSTALFSGLTIDDRWGGLRLDNDWTNSYFLRARSLTPFLPQAMETVFLVRGDGHVGLASDNPLAKLEIQGGAGWDGSGDPKAIALAWGGGGYRHWIRSRHNASDHFGNAIDFFVNNSATAAGSSGPGVGSTATLSLDGGYVGIGTISPQSKLHVAVPATTTPLTAMQLEVNSFSNMTNAVSSAFLSVRDVGSGKMAFYIRGDGNVGIGTSTPQAPLDVVGMTRTCVLQITGGCDVAEPFPVSDSEIPKGALVIIDEENPGNLRLARQEYDTRVAGIISGANGVNPGISLRQEGVMDTGQNVALSGRVYALADASFGSIKPGDLLTSSGTPGHVMKATNHTRGQGAIVGKAMSALKEGKGTVLVLVTLQ